MMLSEVHRNNKIKKLRLVDYYGNHGGSELIALELTRAFLAHFPETKLEWISHGSALERYRKLFDSENLDVISIDIPPVNWRSGNIYGIRGSWKLLSRFGLAEYFYKLSDQCFNGCDAVILPWAIRHRLPADTSIPVIAAYHDTHIFDTRNASRAFVKDEKRTLTELVRSRVEICVLTNVSIDRIRAVTGCTPDRFRVVPPASNHVWRSIGLGEAEWPHIRSIKTPFLIYPANISPHKNHEALFAALAGWVDRWPVVLTGMGSDLSGKDKRSQRLRQSIDRSGLILGRDILGLGYIARQDYHRLLYLSSGLIFPSLLEGFGIPLIEAREFRKPILCSDNPTTREVLGDDTPDVYWFDPRRPASITAEMERLTSKRLLEIRELSPGRTRTWAQVADNYLTLLTGTPGNKS